MAPFFFEKIEKMDKDNNNQELRPSKMRGVAFPKAKYGVIFAIITIILISIVFYKDKFSNLFNSTL